MNRFIEGESIYLRAVEAADAGERYLSWMNDEEVTKGLASGVFPTTIEDLKKYIQNITSSRNAVMFAVCDKENDLHIGNIKLDNFDWVNRTCELGLLLGDRSYWGKGVGTQVMALTLQYAFQQLNIRKVVLAVYANNPAAVRLYEKVGFQKEGCLRDQIFYKGEYIDKYYMGIFSNQFS
jgi:ribosomal-protein-alanine N-acetyltransferase